MIFVTSDWHFSHDREFVYKPRGFNSVEEMNIALVERHNSIVTPEDDVYVLGDLCLGGADSLERNKEFISSMNGKLHIAFGNHCTDSRKKMYAELPNVVETAWAIALKYRKYHFYMSHFPTLTGNLEKESLKQMTLNLYGHTHQRTNFFEDRPYMYHVGVDSHDCYPVSLDKVIEDMNLKVKECIEIAAQAEAEANSKIAASLTPELIEKIKYEQWNGQMPSTMTGTDSSILITP